MTITIIIISGNKEQVEKYMRKRVKDLCLAKYRTGIIPGRSIMVVQSFYKCIICVVFLILNRY